MNKRELVAKAIKLIRKDIEMLNCYSKERNWDLYRFTHGQILARMEMLLELEILTFNQWDRLFKIIVKATS